VRSSLALPAGNFNSPGSDQSAAITATKTGSFEVAKRKPQHRSPVHTESVAPHETDWVRIAAVLLLFAGALNILDGISAFAKDDLFNSDKLLFSDVHTWGIIYIVLGAMQIWAASLINIRHASGMLMGITFATIGGIAHFLSIGSFPIWSLIVMGLSFGVLFVLLTHSDEFA
jgi:hypothetical protein